MASHVNESADRGFVEETPVIVHLPMRPVFDQRSDSARTIRSLTPVGFESPVTNLEALDRNRREISDAFRARFERGRRGAVVELLNVNREFIGEGWVKEAIVSLFESGWPKRPAGRPEGQSEETRHLGLMIAAYVDHLTGTTGKSKDSVFQELAARNFECLSVESIKRHYYRIQDEPRLRPLLFRRLDQRTVHRVGDPETCFDVAREIEAVKRREGDSFSSDDVTVTLEFTGELRADPLT
jgi:hypothetical protein